jgi:Putative transposase/Transposase zinc-binding domain
MPTIQQILQDHFDELAASGTLSAPQQRAGWALRKCRTAALGGHVQRCPNGHVEQVWYNSCRHRACPQCNGLAKERWLQRTQARLIECAHWHVIFTIPHQLNVLWQLNTAAMMDALFAAARETLLELLGDPRHLGAQAGLQLALHTWTRGMDLHPHIHALVSDGGMRAGVWVSPRRSHFLPAKVVMLLFRGKLLDALRTLHRRGQLRLPDAMSPERLNSLLNRLGRKVKWNVRVCTRYAHGRGVSLYLARYVKGGPYRNTQIVRASASEVLFRYTPNSEAGQPKRSAVLALAPAHFLARLLQHAPEPGRHTVRYYGLYAHACAAQLNVARALHAQAPVEPPVPIEWQTYLVRFPRALAATRCPQCQAPLVRGALLLAKPHPP